MENIFGYNIHSGSGQLIKVTGGPAVEFSQDLFTEDDFKWALYRNEIGPDSLIFIMVGDKYKKAIIVYPVSFDNISNIEIYYENEESDCGISRWQPSDPDAEEILVVTFYVHIIK